MVVSAADYAVIMRSCRRMLMWLDNARSYRTVPAIATDCISGIINNDLMHVLIKSMRNYVSNAEKDNRYTISHVRLHLDRESQEHSDFLENAD